MSTKLVINLWRHSLTNHTWEFLAYPTGEGGYAFDDNNVRNDFIKL